MSSLLTPALLLFLQSAPLPVSAPASACTVADLGFTFTYPDFVRPRVEPEILRKLELSQPSHKKTIYDCMSSPLWALGRGGSAQTDELNLQRTDQNCNRYSTSSHQLRLQARGASAATLIDMGRHTITSKAYLFSLNGSEAYFTYASTSTGVTSSYAAAVCTIQQNNVLCWRAFSVTDSHLRALLAGTITFAGQPSQPLVPADLLLLLPPDGPPPEQGIFERTVPTPPNHNEE